MPKRRNRVFPLCVSVLPDFNQLIAGLIYCLLTRICMILMLLHDSLNLVVSGVKLWTVMDLWCHGSGERKEVESFAQQQLDCVERKMH